MHTGQGSSAPRVFLALCERDRPAAAPLLASLRASGLEPAPFPAAGEELPAPCALLIAAVTPGALLSHAWRSAFLHAVQQGLPVFCLVHPQAEPSPAMRMLLSGLSPLPLGPESAQAVLAEPAVRACLGPAPRYCLRTPDGAAYPITHTGYTIGRDPSCDLCLASPSVSRFHALITLDQDVAGLTDTDSMNGTCLNDIPLDPGDMCEMEPGDELRIGESRFLFTENPAH